jgi:hypothetical protein
MYPHLNVHNSSTLVHIHQKKKLASKIATQIASINGPLKNRTFDKHIHKKLQLLQVVLQISIITGKPRKGLLYRVPNLIVIYL